MKKHVFIIGSRGLPAKYGGFETFVEELVKHQNNKNIKYFIVNNFKILLANCIFFPILKLTI